MLVPRYIFKNDFAEFADLLHSYPHKEYFIPAGQYMWSPDEPLDTLHFIKSGLVETSMEHEEGFRKIISFHGPQTIFPGFHQEDFKLERSLSSKAITDTQTIAFTKSTFQSILEEHQSVTFAMLNSYARYVNLLLYETGHQEYNTGFVKLCNLLYLISSENDTALHLTQEDIATILGLSRVSLTRYLSRLREEHIIETGRKILSIKDINSLKAYCSDETVL
ncbi:MAG: Crp/Fnr family transcriptional regulator [Veillonella sp.]|uniref:Crp/Fnr family transcriptional regulator n=1 Tax=Veillonella sp. TaxID=1926307 RepID=UPI0025F25B5C|nr:Crp/Fnr family transcriptional regulator [Veillonella sp.]MBS4912817.1 Crp/Fnr family transcriptional regulator [Veillonella sp.]